MADENRGLVFVIDGSEYDAPSLDEFNMAERRVMFELAGIVEEDFVQNDDETDEDHAARVEKMTRHPGFLEALMHVAYQRSHPDIKRAKVQALIDRTNFHEAIAKWAETDGADDADPPLSESTSKPDEASPSGSFDSNRNSGDDSWKSSDVPVSSPEPIGTSGSDTWPTSRRNLSAV
jgi:hypothetical protein